MSARAWGALVVGLVIASSFAPERALAWTVDGVSLGPGTAEVDFLTDAGDSTDLQADVSCFAAFVVLTLHDKYELTAATGLCSAVDAYTAVCLLPYGSSEVFLTSGGGGDVILANDTCSTLSGVHWVVSSGDWGDYVEVEGASSEIDGGSGDDWLLGGSGTDVLSGGPGADHLEGGAGADVLRGGIGVDTIDARDGAASDTGSGGPGADVISRDFGDAVTQ